MEVNESSKEYENALIDNGFDYILSKNMADMMKFFMLNNIDAETVTPEQLDNIRGTGISALIASLGDSGFLPKDYNGREFTFEQLFYAAMMPDWNKENIETYFGENTISESRERTRLDPNNPNTKYTGEIDGRKLYVREVKLNELSPGDEVVEIYKNENIEIRKVYKVDRVNKATLEISEGDKKGVLENISGKRSYLKVENEKDIDKEKYNNELVQVFSAEVVSEKEFHLNPLKTESNDWTNTIEMSEIYYFFNEIKTINDLRELTNDQERLENWYNRLRILETERAVPLANFLKNSMVSKLFADIIQSEVPEALAGRPALVTYMIYTMAVDPTKEIHSMFDPFIDPLDSNKKIDKVWEKNLKGNTSLLSTARMLDSSNIPIHLITSFAENAITRTFIDQSIFDEEYEEIRRKIKLASPAEFNEDNLYESYGRNKKLRLYKFASDKSLTSLEKRFIKFLHKYHSKYNAEYRFKRQETQISEPRIKVAANFLRYEEFADKFKIKRRFGKELYEALKPEAYDSIPIKIKSRTRTLGHVKEQFAINVFNEKVIDTAALQFNIPILSQYKNATNNGLVNNVYELKKARHQAMKLYSSGYSKTRAGKLNKISPIHSGFGKDRTALLATKRVVDAEQVHIKSQISRHHMKGVIPIVDWVNMVVNKDDNIGTMLVWIDKWVNYVVHNKRPSGMFDKKLANERVLRALLQVLKYNSLNKIACSIKTQGFNLMIGQILNLARNYHAFKKGIFRMLSNHKKVFDIVKHCRLTNFYKQDYYTAKKTFLYKATACSYVLMEKAEQINLYPIYIGLMTDTEWDNPETITDNRARRLSHKIKDIHGDNSHVSSSPGYETIMGISILRFIKWIPTTIEILFGKYKRTSDGEIKSGIFTVLSILWNKYKLKDQDVRNSMLKKIMNDLEFNFDINNTREYLAYLIAKEQRNEIKKA